MNHRAMAQEKPRNWKSNFAAALIGLGAISAISSCSQPPPPLEGAAIGGPFELTNPAGETVRWKDFDGQYRIVYFGYAYCPDVCPFDVQRMVAGLNLFAADNPDLAKDIRPIFITIDPERDTPEVMGEFTANFSDDLIGLTGTAEQIKAAADAFVVYYSKGEVSQGGGYLMSHSNAAFLMGRDGEPIALLPVDIDAQSVAAELENWVN